MEEHITISEMMHNYHSELENLVKKQQEEKNTLIDEHFEKLFLNVSDFCKKMSTAKLTPDLKKHVIEKLKHTFEVLENNSELREKVYGRPTPKFTEGDSKEIVPKKESNTQVGESIKEFSQNFFKEHKNLCIGVIGQISGDKIGIRKVAKDYGIGHDNIDFCDKYLENGKSEHHLKAFGNKKYIVVFIAQIAHNVQGLEGVGGLKERLKSTGIKNPIICNDGGFLNLNKSSFEKYLNGFLLNLKKETEEKIAA